MDFLDQMEQLTGEAENLVLTSYQNEYKKLDQIADILTKMIKDYKEKIQERLTMSLVRERNNLNEHLRAISDRKNEASSIFDSLNNAVDQEIKVIHDNEQEYHRLQSEHYRLQQ